MFARTQLRLSALANNFISNSFELHSLCEHKNEVMLRINEVFHNEVLRNEVAFGKRIEFLSLLCYNYKKLVVNVLAIYFIDYENVHVDGLKGVARLNEDDSVCIFYSEKANTLTFGLHKRLIESNANIEYIKVSVGTPNSLDFQLTSILGYKIAKEEKQEYVIVSKDKGFDSTVEFWAKKRIQISRVEDITTDVQNSKNEFIKEISNLIGSENEKYISNIYEALSERKSKEGVHNYLMKELHDNKKVTELYKKIKPLLKDKS